MKEVVYSDREVYLLTNKEFGEALMSWDQKKNYWCQRIEKLLPPFILHAGTPDIEKGREIFLLPLMIGDKIVKLRRIFKDEDGKYQEILDDNGSLMSVSDIEIEQRRLILQEDYYNKPKELSESKKNKQIS